MAKKRKPDLRVVSGKNANEIESVGNQPADNNVQIVSSEETKIDDLTDLLMEKGYEIRLNSRMRVEEFRVNNSDEWRPINQYVNADIRTEIGAEDWTDKIWKMKYRTTLNRNSYDPFKKYLEDLYGEWDKTPRIDQFCETAWSIVEDETNIAFAQWVGRHIFLGAVKRTFEPGAKLDTTPIIIGGQDVGKSTHIKEVFPSFLRKFFMEGLKLDLPHHKLVHNILGKAVVELSEMDGVSTAKMTQLKAFMTTTTDSALLNHARYPESFPRNCVFIGTANDDRAGLLPNDPTGNRRWVPVELKSGLKGRGVPIGHFDNRDIQDQLWAEAVYRIIELKEDASFPEKLKQHQREINEYYLPPNPIADKFQEIEKQAIDEANQTRENTKHKGIELSRVCELLGLSQKEKKNHEAVSVIMKKNGWTKTKQAVKISGVRKYLWRPPDPV